MRVSMSRVGRTGRGMTLLEVLAAVFVLGMGLIMVAGAFPVGAHQTRLTVEQTESAVFARSAAELCRLERYIRNLDQMQYRGFSSGKPQAIPVGSNGEEWRVWNPERLPYLENWRESMMWPPGGGDYVFRAYVTRVADCDQAPLFRLTLVVIRYSNDAREFYHPELDVPFDRTVTVVRVRDREVTGRRSNEFELPTRDSDELNTSKPRTDPSRVTDQRTRPGDYIMDPYTGWCYRIATVEKNKVMLAEEPATEMASVGGQGMQFPIFRNVVGVYYKLISE